MTSADTSGRPGNLRRSPMANATLAVGGRIWRIFPLLISAETQTLLQDPGMSLKSKLRRTTASPDHRHARACPCKHRLGRRRRYIRRQSAATTQCFDSARSLSKRDALSALSQTPSWHAAESLRCRPALRSPTEGRRATRRQCSTTLPVPPQQLCPRLSSQLILCLTRRPPATGLCNATDTAPILELRTVALTCNALLESSRIRTQWGRPGRSTLNKTFHSTRY